MKLGIITSAVIMCAAASLVGCGSPTPGNTYTVIIDPTFGEKMGDVTSEFYEWQNVAQGTGLYFNLGVDNVTCDKGCPNTITIHPATVAQINAMGEGNTFVGITWRDWQNDSATVFIGSDIKDPAEWHVTVQHEIGHALGLEHDDAKGKTTIMYPGWGNDVARSVSCRDIGQYLAVRHAGFPSCMQ